MFLKATRELTHHGTLAMLSAAIETAEAIGRPQCIVIVDASGETLGEIRMTGAKFLSRKSALAKEAGFRDPRMVASRPLGIGDPAVAAKLDGITFHSATYRLFKLDGLESQCEDYGQAVRYRGTVPGQERVFELDGHHHIEAGRMFPICGNSWKMLADTRFAEHFEFFGDFSTHYGIYPDCGTLFPLAGAAPQVASGGGCC